MSKKCLSLAVILLLLIPFIVEAESMFEENFEHEQIELKSESQALVMSLAATVMPFVLGGPLSSGDIEEFGLALALGGLILGPSTGHFYARQTGRGFKGVAIRLAIALGGAYSISSASEERHPDVSAMSFGYEAMLVGAVILVHGMYDIFTAPSSVRRYNESLLQENSLRLVPQVNLVDKSCGLSIVYNF